MNVPDDLRYTSDHEWARLEDGRVTVGLTEYAQDALGDVVFVQLPEPGEQVAKGDSVAEVESTKSVSDVYVPLAGRIGALNTDLADSPQLVNDDPYGEGWLFVVEGVDQAAFGELLDAAQYRALIDG